MIDLFLAPPPWTPPICETVDGNADGSWCVIFNPKTGGYYVVDWSFDW
jgi:hypothetical protein